MVFGPSAGGFVLGMARMLVNPPAAAARVPVAMVSFWLPPGSRRWTCMSMRPGATMRPFASMTGTEESVRRGGAFRDASLDDEEIADFVPARGGIDDASPANEKGMGFARRIRTGRRDRSHWGKLKGNSFFDKANLHARKASPLKCRGIKRGRLSTLMKAALISLLFFSGLLWSWGSADTFIWPTRRPNVRPRARPTWTKAFPPLFPIGPRTNCSKG